MTDKKISPKKEIDYVKYKNRYVDIINDFTNSANSHNQYFGTKSKYQSYKNQNNQSTLWIEKYSPTKLSEYIGNQDVVQKAQQWLSDFENNKKGTPRFLILNGKSGVGKTLLAYCLFKDNNYDITELNAGTDKSRNAVNSSIKFMGSSTIGSLFGLSSKRGVILDELDSIDSNQKIGIQDFLKILELNNTKSLNSDVFYYPIICTTNNSKSHYLENIKKYALELEVNQPTYESIEYICNKIIKNEKLNISKLAIPKIIQSTEYDFRQVINYLYLLSLEKTKITNQNCLEYIDKYNQKDKLFLLNDCLKFIFNKMLPIEIALKYFENNKSKFALYLQENYLKIIINSPLTKSQKLKLITNISRLLVKGDNYNYYYWNNFDPDFNVYQGLFQVIYPNYYLTKSKGFNYLNKNPIIFQEPKLTANRPMFLWNYLKDISLKMNFDRYLNNTLLLELIINKALGEDKEEFFEFLKTIEWTYSDFEKVNRGQSYNSEIRKNKDSIILKHKVDWRNRLKSIPYSSIHPI